VEGADVVVNDVTPRPHRENRSDWRGLPDVVREIESLGCRLVARTADVTHAGQVDDMLRQSVEHFGHIDIIVNNAGALAGRDRAPVVELEVEQWDRIQRVNVKGTFLCSRAAARHMIDRGQGGKIINISSAVGQRGMARYAAYCASKFAVIDFRPVTRLRTCATT